MPAMARSTPGEYAFMVTVFSIGWLAVSTSAFIDVFVFAKARRDIATATEEFDLYPSMRASIYSSFYLGWLFGDPFFGWISDVWGRRPAVYAAFALGFLFQAAGSLAVGPYSLFTLRFVSGVCMGGGDLVALVYCLELSSNAQRATSGAIMQTFFACGLCLTAAIAVVFPLWRQMYLTSALPGLAFLMTWWWMPESPKWLAAQLRQGKIKSSDKIGNSQADNADQHRSLLNITDTAAAKSDTAEKGEGKRDSQGSIGGGVGGAQEDLSYAELLRDGDTSCLLALVCVPWLCSGFLYYGITLSAGTITPEIHLNMFLMGIVEIPGYIAATYLSDTIGRKLTFIGLTLTAAFFCLVSWGYPEKGGRLMFALFGKIFASGAFGLIWVWSPEMFPTTARSLTTAIGSQAGRVGSILAPYIVVIMSEMDDMSGGQPPLPQPVFAAVAVTNCIFCWWLPETVGGDLV